MARLIAEHTGQTQEQISKDSDRDRWFSAEEAKDYGFVDHVVHPVRPGHQGAGVGRPTPSPTARPTTPTEPGGTPRTLETHMMINPTARLGDVAQPSNRYILPQFEERTAYGMKRSDPYNKLFEDRIIFLGVQVDDASADDIIAQLLVLESLDPDRDILMYINSPGGSFTAMTAIYDTMQFVRPDIQTFVIGQAASAAAVLLGAGATGKRFALPNARILIHQPALSGGDVRPGVRHRDPGQRGAADAHLARGHARPPHRPHVRDGPRPTSSATRSCRPPRRWSTA